MNKVFSFVKVVPGSMVASTKLAQFIADELKIPVSCDASVAEEPLDTLIIINGAFAFCPVLAELGKAIEQAHRVVWVQQDYSIVPPKSTSSAESPFRAAFRNRAVAGKSLTDFWTTVEKYSRPSDECGPGSQYINWNVLTTWDIPRKQPTLERIAYYGAFRENRINYFNRYFANPLIHVSSPSHKKMAEKWPDMTIEPKIHDLLPWLQRFRAGLYLEDKKMHGSYHSPGNRFYEMLSAHVPIIFQTEARYGLDRAGYDTRTCEAFTADSLTDRFHESEQILELQQPWRERAIRERAELPTQLQEVWKKHQCG